MKISIIVAAAANHVIGREGNLPWRLSADLKHFKEKTLHQVILMGRKTFESIGRPLPKRESWVISRQEMYPVSEGVSLFTSLEAAFREANARNLEELIIIGGEEIYRQALPYVDMIYLTSVNASPEGDAFFKLPDEKHWQKETLEIYQADEKNEFDFEIIKLVRDLDHPSQKF